MPQLSLNLFHIHARVEHHARRGVAGNVRVKEPELTCFFQAPEKVVYGGLRERPAVAVAEQHAVVTSAIGGENLLGDPAPLGQPGVDGAPVRVIRGDKDFAGPRLQGAQPPVFQSVDQVNHASPLV